jgi:SpoVK/Ycf46/Vps4 family AAA+-type ATPase
LLWGSTSNNLQDSHNCRSKAEFLVQLDGLATSSESSVLFLASTNLPWTLDPAIVRRFQNVFHVGLPDKGERKQMLHLKTGLSEPILDQLVEVTDGYTGSDLDRGCTEAKRRLFGKMVEEATTWETRKKGHTQTFSRSQKDPDALKLTSEELVDIFKACGPNLLSDGWKKSYDKWRKRGQKY